MAHVLISKCDKTSSTVNPHAHPAALVGAKAIDLFPRHPLHDLGSHVLKA
jgi:hypothetical protein